MKNFIKPFALFCVIACAIGLVPAQQLQTLDSTDSEKTRRVKTNDNFTLLNSRYQSLSAGKLSATTTSPANGQAIVFENGTWKNKALPAGNGLVLSGSGNPALGLVTSVVLDNSEGFNLSSPVAGTAKLALQVPWSKITKTPSDVVSSLGAAPAINCSNCTGITGATGGVDNTGTTTIGADSDDDGGGKISFQIGGTEVAAFDNNGVFTQASGVSPKVFGAHADGATDDSTALNAAASVAAALKLPVELDGATYAIGSSLDGSIPNVAFRCASGRAKFIKLNTSGTNAILANVSGAYKGWSFEGIEFDGGGAAQFGLTIVLTDTSDVRFTRCKFRRLVGVLTLQAASRIAFNDCDFYGTQPGIMQSGTYDPPAVANASYAPGVHVGGGCNDIVAEKCRFNFVADGAFAQGGTSATHTKNFTVKGCTFRGDYFNGPYARLRFSITNYSSGTATVAAGGLTGHFTTGSTPNTVSIAVPVGSGSNLSGFAGQWTTPGSFGSVRIGDVIETVNGKRAEILSVTDSQNVQVAEWESMDTYEPTSPPAANTNWRVNRYYAASAQIIDDTHLQFYFEPVNVFTGELITAAGVSTPWTCRELPNIGYTGIHINAGSANTLIEGNTFRGGWGDQISIWNTSQPRVIGNTVEYGQDQGLTLTFCPRSITVGNTFRYSGVSAVSLNQSDYSVVANNTFDSWGVVNRGFVGRGAVQSEDTEPGLVIEGNSFSYNQATNFGGQSPYFVSVINGAATGSVVRNNTGQSRTADLYVDAAAGAVLAEVRSIGGAGASSVYSFKTVAPALFGSLTAAANSVLEVHSTNDAVSIFSIINQAGIPKYNFLSTSAFFNAAPATSGADLSSPIFSWRSTYWNGSASAQEALNFGNYRLAAGAGNYAGRFSDNDGVFPLSMSGKGGQVAVGYAFPSNANLATLGQFHIRSLAATTPAFTAQRFSALSTADIFTALDENSTPLGVGLTFGGTWYQRRVAANSGAAITLNLATGNIKEVTLDANTTVSLSNLKVGTFTIAMIQDGTGSRTVSWPASIKWPGGTAPTLTATAGARDVFVGYCDGTNLYIHTKALDVK